MDRFHTRIDEIRESQIKMCECVERIEKFGEDMHRVMYGNNGADGIIIKITRLFERVSLHSKIIVGVFFTGVFAILITAVIKYVSNNIK